ncbi:DUF2235 domain-containing protein [Vibrio metschnikovii]|uniref:DUF2235 domain-containing protein n=1 Tax=Vibrio metschnikovii TaxID=28172 RepID=UPI002FCB9500
MTYKAVRITELMAHEFAQVEGALDSLDKKALKAAIPANFSVDQFIEQVEQGHWLLLNDSPVTPMLIKESNEMGNAAWVINNQTIDRLEPAAQKALLARTDMTGAVSGATQSRNLHPPLPMAPYIPEPPKPSDSDKPLPLKYEYCFEIACSDESFRHRVCCSFVLAKTKNEAMLGRWTESKTEHGTRYTVLTAVDEPKRLVAEIASYPMGISLEEPVKVKPIGTQTAYEGFIPVCPAVQLGERLGLPTEGYFYHFHDGKLIQEYKLLGDKKWSFYGTRSTSERLDDTQAYNMYQNALLVYWKIGGKIVENQYLVYLEQQITRDVLDNLNDEWLSQHGVKLTIPALLEAAKQPVIAREDKSQTEEPQENRASYGLPPAAPDAFNHPLNAFYDYSERFLVDTNVKAINVNHSLVPDIPLVNVRAERTLRIGVFFDGTGQNNPNDEYKETYGNKSRTNVARLFDAYPEREGESAKIYISGVGTVDGIPISPGEPNPIIDAGGDEKLAGQAMGAFDDTGGLWKWQSLLQGINGIIRRLGEDFKQIQHIQFDVFGFSRGAALARHFINAVSEGFPDYINPNRSSNPSSLVPNLLGNENYKRFDSLSKEFYAIDTTRRVSVRFVGLFDTVGSFYLPGNENEGNYQLGLKPNAAERVFQICAQHEYRKNFPLTSLGQGHQEAIAFTDGIFCQEVFPGSHTDVGGGYPSKRQYSRTDLPSRLNTPVDSTYNRHLIKQESFFEKYKDELQSIREANAGAAFVRQKLVVENQTWQKETLEKDGIYGEVKSVNGQLLYYHFVPISNAISALAFERMKQQAELHGIIWDRDVLNVFKNAPFDENNDQFINNMWERLKNSPLGSIYNQWAEDEDTLLHSYIHRPHDALINPGYGGITDALVNAISLDSNRQPKRKVFNNG